MLLAEVTCYAFRRIRGYCTLRLLSGSAFVAFHALLPCEVVARWRDFHTKKTGVLAVPFARLLGLKKAVFGSSTLGTSKNSKIFSLKRSTVGGDLAEIKHDKR